MPDTEHTRNGRPGYWAESAMWVYTDGGPQDPDHNVTDEDRKRWADNDNMPRPGSPADPDPFFTKKGKKPRGNRAGSRFA